VKDILAVSGEVRAYMNPGASKAIKPDYEFMFEDINELKERFSWVFVLDQSTLEDNHISEDETPRHP
jgi:hypothetical protein